MLLYRAGPSGRAPWTAVSREDRGRGRPGVVGRGVRGQDPAQRQGFPAPEVWFSSCRMTGRAPWRGRKPGTTESTGASRSSWPASTSTMAAVAVAILDMENQRKRVAGVTGRRAARSASPKPSANSSRSASVTASDSPGT